MPERRHFLAPGRVNLIGEHTDHSGGLVMPVAIAQGLTLRADLGGETIELTSTRHPGTVAIAADGSGEAGEGWGRYVAAVAGELAVAGRPPLGMRGHIESDLPDGSGLSSSAALEVVVAIALLAAADMSMEPLELAALCRRAEHRAVGVPSGIMDQAASLLGRQGHAVLLDCELLEYRLVPLPVNRLLLVVDSGVRRELASSGYADRTRELGEALPALGGRRPTEVHDDEVAALIAHLPPVPARRLRHVLTENRRVLAAEAALRDGDLDALGAIMAAGHASLRDDFEVTIPELDTLVELAREAGADAARMTGGGFGGSIVAVVEAARADAIADEVLAAYRRAHPDRQASALVSSAADGARELGSA